MTDQPDPTDYLQGRTNPCYRHGCMRRLQNKDDTICYQCRMAEERPNYAEQLLAAKNVPSDKWYYLWHFQTTLWEESKTPSLVCKSCETKWPADEMGEYTKGVFKPFITHCPLVKKCRAAAVYWATTAD